MGRLLAADPLTQTAGAAISNCAQALRLVLEGLPSGQVLAHLGTYNPCRRRGCPMCEWRIARAHRAKLLTGLEGYFQDHPTDRALFLTLTVRNVPVEGLAEAIKELHSSWDRLCKWRAFPSSAWMRRTEVTISNGQESSRRGRKGEEDSSLKNVRPRGIQARPTSDVAAVIGAGGDPYRPVTAHPHLHALLLVPSSYFSHGYITKEEWRQQWMMAARLDYAPVTDVRAVYNKKGKTSAADDMRAAASEAAKYAVKASDYLKAGTMAPELVQQMRGHRLIGYSKALRQYIPKPEVSLEEMTTDAQALRPSINPQIEAIAIWDELLSDYHTLPAEGGA